MKTPIAVRPLSDEERWELRKGRRSSDAFRARRSQMILASADGQRAPQLAKAIGYSDQGVRKVIQQFNREGLSVLQASSAVPHHSEVSFSPAHAQRLRALVHQSPRTCGKPTSRWTLALLAAVSFEQGLSATRVSAETVRQTLQRLGVRWRRAKHWISSPDPHYRRKKTRVSD